MSHSLKDLAIQAVKYAEAAEHTARCKEALRDAYREFRHQTNPGEYLEKNSPQWAAMMVATAPEYRELESAKARERRARAKLLQLAKGV